MIEYGKWTIGIDEISKKLVVVENGAIGIWRECWIFGEEVDVTLPNGCVMSDWHEEKGAFEEIIVADSVTSIDERAFYRHTCLKKISVLKNVISIGKEAFKGCDNLPFVVAPNVKIQDVSDPETKIKLAAGFLLNRELYSDEVAEGFEDYAKKQKSKIALHFEKFNLNYNSENKNVENLTVNIPISKLSKKEFREKLERVIISGNKRDIEALFDAADSKMFSAEILELICRHGNKEMVAYILNKDILSKVKMNYLLYLSVLQSKSDIKDLLLDSGAYIDVPWILADADHNNCISELNEYLEYIKECDYEKRIRILTQLKALINNKAMYLTENVWIAFTANFNIEIAKNLLNGSDLSNINKKHFLERALQIEAEPQVFALLIENGFIKSVKQCEELIEKAVNENKGEYAAILLDYKNKSATLSKKAEYLQDKGRKELNTTFDSAVEFGKLWGYKKKADGTLIITEYKGQETEVKIPEAIGKSAVTELGERVFATNAKKISNQEVRIKITKIEIPSTITIIGNSAFWGCASLEEIDIPDSVTKMGTFMFTKCSSLKRIKMSKKHKGKLGDDFFSSCESLTTLSLPSGITSVGLCALSGCFNLKDIYMKKSIKNLEYSSLNYIEGVTIHAPAGSYAEQYAKENNIPFVAE